MSTRYRFGERDRDRENDQYNRQNYSSYGRGGWDNERNDVEDRDERYGGYMGGYGRGSSEPYNTYGRSYNEPYGSSSGRNYRESSGSSQRYNYPTGFRSTRDRDEETGGSYDYNRGMYGRGRYGRDEDTSRFGRSYENRSYENLYGRGEDRGSYGTNYGSANYGSESRYGRGESSSQYNRPEDRWGRYDRDTGERGWWDRASDEVASWFGDDEAQRRRQMDQRYEHRGRGPKGYKRSDERIKEDVNDRLTDDYRLDASEIDVQVNDGEVVLTGSVNSRNDKRRAEDIAESVSGVKNVECRLRVQPSSSTATYAGTGTSTTGSTPATSSSSLAAGAGTSTGSRSGRTSGT